jgi:hypothetical protein
MCVQGAEPGVLNEVSGVVSVFYTDFSTEVLKIPSYFASPKDATKKKPPSPAALT